MGRGAASVLLAVLGAGVFLSGLELMVTAVALPSIVTDLADWSRLRTASWIVNGYLLASIVTMPLAGRAVDRWGVRRPFLWAIVLFTIGSALAGRAQSLEELVGARLLQAVVGGALVPIATAAAAVLFDGPARPRALGVIGGLTFLGMAAGPFVGAWIIQAAHPAALLDTLGVPITARAAFDAPWRFVFYVNVPIGLAALALGWAGTAGWAETPRPTRFDLPGALAFSLGLAAVLLGLTLAGSDEIAGTAAAPAIAGLVLVGVLGMLAAAVVGRRAVAPFVDPVWFRNRAFTSAALVSLLTGYGFATAIIGGAVFVDRVLYGGPDVQRLGLGALAFATAVGALASGLALRIVGVRATSVAGLALAIVALVRMSSWDPATSVADVAVSLGAFGLGFGLTITPRSTAAVEALGREASGIASATVTVARMVGMAVGLAVLSAFGSTVISRVLAAVYATPDAYRQFIPEALRSRSLKDGLVVQALESWASAEAARILLGVFLVAAAVVAIALVPALTLARRGAGAADPAGDAQTADPAGGASLAV